MVLIGRIGAPAARQERIGPRETGQSFAQTITKGIAWMTERRSWSKMSKLASVQQNQDDMLIYHKEKPDTMWIMAERAMEVRQ